MKKLLTVLTAVLLLSSTAALAADASNWSVKLAFSSAGAADVMEVTIGEGTASEMLKPPPLPGKVVTGDSANAIVNAYAYMSATQKSLAKSILAPDATAVARMWEIQVEAEEAGPVYMTPDLTGKNPSSDVNYLIIDGDTGSKKNIVTDLVDGKVQVYTSTGAKKTLYAMVGTSESFAIAKSDGTVIGSVEKTVDGLTDVSGVKVYVDGSGSPSATTIADGSFTFSGLSQGTHTVTLDEDYALPSTITGLEVPASGANALPAVDLRRCDFDNDNTECAFQDFKILKKAYKAENDVADEFGNFRYDAAADANGDGKVDFQDFKVLKKNYKDKVE